MFSTTFWVKIYFLAFLELKIDWQISIYWAKYTENGFLTLLRRFLTYFSHPLCEWEPTGVV